MAGACIQKVPCDGKQKIHMYEGEVKRLNWSGTNFTEKWERFVHNNLGSLLRNPGKHTGRF